MDKLKLLLLIMLGLTICGWFLFWSVLTFPEKEEPLICPEEKCEKENAKIIDLKEFYKQEINERNNKIEDKEELLIQLANDYYDCYWAYVCSQNEQWCLSERSFSEENLKYEYMICELATNYNKYYDYFWGEDKK